MIKFSCPRCRSGLSARDDKVGVKFACPKCGQRLEVPLSFTKPELPQLTSKTIIGDVVSEQLPTPLPDWIDLEEQHETPSFEMVNRKPDHVQVVYLPPPPPATPEPVDPTKRYSGLGIASFLIAFLIGGLDLIMAVVVAISIARSTNRYQLETSFVGGGTAMLCMNFMSIPFCLVGLGLAAVSLNVHRNHNHLYTWIGLLGNGVVIFGVVVFYIFVNLIR